MDNSGRLSKRKMLRPGSAAFVATSLVATAGIAGTQAVRPADSKGTFTRGLGAIELGSETEGLAGRQLRARAVTIEPGGHTAAHSHHGRPTMEYVAQGTVIEIRNGIEVQHIAGEMVAATKEVTHWWENRGSVPVVLVPVDVFQP